MFTQRLDKLEADLQLLITMHDLFLQSDEESVNDGTGKSITCTEWCGHDDLPERDTTYKAKVKIKADQSSVNRVRHKFGEKKAPSAVKPAANNEPEVTTHDNKINLEQGVEDDVKTLESQNLKDLRHENEFLKEEIKTEKKLRAEVEDSAKHVYIQLQKVKEEIQREKETRESLLVESFNWKSQSQENLTQVERLKSDLRSFKSEIVQLESKVQTLSTEKANTAQRLFYLCSDMGYNRGFSQEEECFAFLKTHFQELNKRCNSEDWSEKIRKLTSQLNSLVGRCATVEKERDTMKEKLTEYQDSETRLKGQLHMCQITVTSAESELLKKQIEFECVLQKVQTDSQMEKERFSVKMSEYSSLIKKSKDLLLSLRKDRDETRQRLKDALDSRNYFELQIKTLTADREILMTETEKHRQKISEMSHEKIESIEHWQMEKINLDFTIKKHINDRRKCMELLSEMKYQLINMKHKYSQDTSTYNVEKDKLINENKRLQENLSVLKKVSEDQGHTISKLRSDMEDAKNSNFKVDTQLREYQSAENQWIKKLDQSDKLNERYRRHIDELEEKVEKYGEELQNHDCADFVDSKYKRKAEQLHETFQDKIQEWQDTADELKKAKDTAMTLSRENEQKLVDMKMRHDAGILEVKTKFQAEMQRTSNLYQKREEEKSGKIRELQSELDRIKNSSSQIQRALSTKIKQLQTALNICLGGSISTLLPPNKSTTLGAASPLHHYNHPVAAFGNMTESAGGLYNGSSCCVNNNINNNTTPANLLNVEGGQRSESRTCFDFGNPDVGECTSAEFNNETCTRTDYFSDFVTSLLL